MAAAMEAAQTQRQQRQTQRRSALTVGEFVDKACAMVPTEQPAFRHTELPELPEEASSLLSVARLSVDRLRRGVESFVGAVAERVEVNVEEDEAGVGIFAPRNQLAKALVLVPFSPARSQRRTERRRAKQAEAAAVASSSSWPDRGRPPPPADISTSKMAIVTTASLPWMTGTAVNPLLRAAFLAKRGTPVTLVVPWLGRADQARVYPNSLTFETPAAQEEWIREWLARRVGFEADFKLSFYPARYTKDKGSILADGDITQFIPPDVADVCVLEEPEHLNWYHHGARWTDRFRHVVGVMHTNYLEYARHEAYGALKTVSLRYVNKWMCRAHCDKVIKLSDAVQPLPRETTTNVHGVCPHFLSIGDVRSEMARGGSDAFPGGAYFVGKVLWSKGYRELLDLMHWQRENEGASFPIDAFGGGEDLQAVDSLAARRGLEVRMKGPLDHSDAAVHDYKVFVNAAESDVLCTCTAEALAMGKFVVLKDNASNQFFREFPNARFFRTPLEFSSTIKECLAATPEPLDEERRHLLTWEAATERFLEAAAPGVGDGRVGPREERPRHVRAIDRVLADTHYSLTKIDAVRDAAGANPQSQTLSVEQALDLGVEKADGPAGTLARP